MIDKAEIDSKAAEFEVLPANVQRDYVFGWLLNALFTQSPLKERLFLKGGNALRKGYFSNTRYSGDLDFGIPNDIPQGELVKVLNTSCEFIKGKSGIEFITESNNVREKFTASTAPPPGLKVYESRIYFKDFYGHADHIKIKVSMDLTRFDKVILPVQSRELIHPYSDAKELACAIRCVKLEEIIAAKLKCLLQREHPPDLFDYAFAITQMGGTLDRKEVARTLVQKTIFSRNPFVLKGILKGTAFQYFRDAWAATVVCAKAYFIEAADAIAALLGDLDALFADYPDNHFAQFAYFNADLRGPILEAGRTRTLLSVRYKDADRLIEPYSLKYLEKKDGDQREYLYAYNCSGGESDPGIRMLVPENFQAIKNTDVKFVPRYPIELGKGGEWQARKFLFDPNSPPRARIPRRAARPASGVRYIYVCSTCGRRFARIRQESSLKPHKSRSRNDCHGRTGYYQGTRYS